MTQDIAQTAAARPVRIGQSTAIEQSRAVAEVQAAVTVAQQFPRNMSSAIAAMRQSCSQKALAERAFFRFPRGGTTVSGETIHLARELARCWTNIDYGIKELDRDDDAGVSEMIAYAWDMEANTRVSNAFLVPHSRDREGGKRDKLTALRDIYENNSNMGARRVRECIFAVLPPHLVEEAKELCSKTLREDGGSGKTLPQRIADSIAAFATLGIVVDQLEQKLDRPSARWTDHDMAQLMVIFRSLQRGEVTKEDEFPQKRVQIDEIPGAGVKPAGRKPVGMGADQVTEMEQLFGRVEAEDLAEQLRYIGEVIGRPVDGWSEMTRREADQVLVKLRAWADQADPLVVE